MREVLKASKGIHTILRDKSVPIKRITAKTELLATDLIELLGVKHDGVIAVAIAAPQVGELVRMFAYRINPYSDVPDTRVIINPEIVSCRKLVLMKETCLSIPGKAFMLKRYKTVKIRGTNIYGKHCSFKESGIVAQMFQHEIDHLDGVLIDETGEEIT